MATEPYTLSVVATLPPDTGQPVGSRDYTASGVFTHKQEAKLELPASGTFDVDFGTIPNTGAKLVFIEYENNAPGLAPINVRINGGTDNAQISPGGLYLNSNPSPTVGITELSLIHTSVGTVRILLLA